MVNRFVGSDILMNKDVPIMFEAIDGICKQTNNDSSLFNMKEAHAVVNKCKELLEFPSKEKVECSDIGIVSPYKKQCKIIRKLCEKRGYNDITIGTAEVFQGKEKPVMMVSTVRTHGVLGFIISEQVSLIHCSLFIYAIKKNIIWNISAN